MWEYESLRGSYDHFFHKVFMFTDPHIWDNFLDPPTPIPSELVYKLYTPRDLLKSSFQHNKWRPILGFLKKVISILVRRGQTWKNLADGFNPCQMNPNLADQSDTYQIDPTSHSFIKSIFGSIWNPCRSIQLMGDWSGILWIDPIWLRFHFLKPKWFFFILRNVGPQLKLKP